MKWPISLPFAARWSNDIGTVRETREFHWASRAAVIQLILGTVIIGINWHLLPPRIPLWYSKPWGADRLASPFFLLLPLFSAYYVYHVNLALIRMKATEHPMFARILLFTSFVISVLSIALVISVIMLIR